MRTNRRCSSGSSAAFYWLTGSLRIALLLPGAAWRDSAWSCSSTIWRDDSGIGRRLSRPDSLLLATVQFVWQARQGQIDATLCFFTTLGLYGLLRHLLLGPAWRWYVDRLGCCGIRRHHQGRRIPAVARAHSLCGRRRRVAGSLARPLGRGLALGGSGLWRCLQPMSVWLVPMLMAAEGDPELAAYRDEILFRADDRSVRRTPGITASRSGTSSLKSFPFCGCR